MKDLPGLNPHVNDFQRRYVSEVRRCSEMERKLRWVAGELPEPPPPAKPERCSLSPREINILELDEAGISYPTTLRRNAETNSEVMSLLKSRQNQLKMSENRASLFCSGLLRKEPQQFERTCSDGSTHVSVYNELS
ncbi:hypothetical protein SFRURICE_006995 [Spodoptera frugiperda]|nr:hypothetical protein SFRURICE_006995 [Spodoptera frugiperda]